jgi:hypothetical protein
MEAITSSNFCSSGQIYSQSSQEHEECISFPQKNPEKKSLAFYIYTLPKERKNYIHKSPIPPEEGCIIIHHSVTLNSTAPLPGLLTTTAPSVFSALISGNFFP